MHKLVLVYNCKTLKINLCAFCMGLAILVLCYLLNNQARLNQKRLTFQLGRFSFGREYLYIIA